MDEGATWEDQQLTTREAVRVPIIELREAIPGDVIEDVNQKE